MVEIISKERSFNYIRQLKGSIGYRSVAMAASFIAIPLMISYLGQEQFGVWSTLLTVMSWIIFFDLGIGNGLRNKVAESLAKDETIQAKKYITTAYILIGIIALILWVFVFISSYFVPWRVVFNTNSIPESVLQDAFLIAASFIILNFWVGLITALLSAMQRFSLVALSQLLSNLLVLFFVFVLIKTTQASIINLAFFYGVALTASNILLSLWFFRNYPQLRPGTRMDNRNFRPLMTVGLQFFTIQLAVLAIFTTDKMLITHIFGPQYVTQYEVVFKLFSVITYAHGLISAPLGAAYTDAFHRKDFSWIKRMIRNQLIIFLIVIFLTISVVFLARSLITLWIGDTVNVHPNLILSMGFLTLVSVWNNIFGIVLGGIGKIRLGSIYTIFTAILNLPISYYFAVTIDFGLAGVVLGTVTSIMISSILSPIQVYFFIFTKAKSNALYSLLR